MKTNLSLIKSNPENEVHYGSMTTNSETVNIKVSQYKRIINKFRYGLVLQVIRNQLTKIGIEFTPYYLVQEATNCIEVPEIKGPSSEYSVRFLEAKDMKAIAENARGYSEGDLLSRLKEGKLCLGLKYQDNIMAFFE
jgi:hypothetical protein